MTIDRLSDGWMTNPIKVGYFGYLAEIFNPIRREIPTFLVNSSGFCYFIGMSRFIDQSAAVLGRAGAGHPHDGISPARCRLPGLDRRR